MSWNKKLVNLVLGGGGVKGIAYIGAFEEAEARNIHWGSIAGVSAGALAGGFLGAGYSASDLKAIIDAFDMGKIDIKNIDKKVPAIARYIQFNEEYRYHGQEGIYHFLNHSCQRSNSIEEDNVKDRDRGYLNNLMQNIITLSKEGSLADGDYLESWVAKVLAARDVITFADLKGGVADKANPEGYKVRMTAVDVNRAKVIMLPDDLSYYGINPDGFSVARAIRMSTSVPFIFKPVEIRIKKDGFTRIHYFVDGGVLDGFPFWAVDNNSHIPVAGFTLNGGTQKKLFSLDTSLDILKAIVTAVHDIGVPKNIYKTKYIAKIDTTKVDFLDFNLGKEQKEYLYNAGKLPARNLYNNIEHDMLISYRQRWYLPYFLKVRGRRNF